MSPKSKNLSLRHYANLYGCSHSLIATIKKEGIDLDDETLVRPRISSNLVKNQPVFSAGNIPAENTESGLRAVIDRLRDAELNSYKDYIENLKNNPSNAPVSLKIWHSIIDQLRKLETENPKIEEENHDSINRKEMAQVLGDLFQNLRLDLDSLPRKIAYLTQGKNKIEIERITEKETNRIIDSLYACEFLKI